MIVVSDASPFIALARIGRTELLQRLYSRVVVPSAVHDEICIGEIDGGALRSARWIETRSPGDTALVHRLTGEFDQGEAGGNRPRARVPG